MPLFFSGDLGVVPFTIAVPWLGDSFSPPLPSVVPFRSHILLASHDSIALQPQLPFRAPPARTARGGIKASARLPMSPSSDGGRHQRDFDLATALEPPQEVFEPDLKVDFIKDVKPHLG